MPFINLKTNIEISKEKEKSLKVCLGKAIEQIPGKSESWLMVNLEDKQRMYFKGDGSKPLAFIEVQLLGKATRESYEAMTRELCALMEKELSISPNSVYVKYEELEHWGWNNGNF